METSKSFDGYRAPHKSESNIFGTRIFDKGEGAAKKVMKRLRKSIHIAAPHEADGTVLGKPVQEEEEIPIDKIEDEVSNAPPRVVLRKLLLKVTGWYMRSPTARLVVIFAAILSCCTYVVDTYATDDMDAYKRFAYVVDIAAFVIFFADYVFNILFSSTSSTLDYVVSFQGFVDLASLFSILNVFVSEDLSFLSLFRLMRVLKVMRVFRMTSVMLSIDEQVLPNASEAIFFDVLSLVLGILLAWFLFSSLLYTMIQQDEHAFYFAIEEDYDIQEDITFFDCVYIMLVITSTLGFGEFAPANVWGRLFVILVLLSALTVVPVKVGKLVETIGKNPRYLVNSFKPTRKGQGHIVLSANLNSGDFQRLINLILSEGSNDPEIIEHAMPIALLSNSYPSAQLELLLNHPMNVRKVQFFVGNIKNHSDLKRVKASTAKAILIFSDFSDRNARETVDSVIQDDYSLKLKVVSLLNYLDQEAKKRMLEPTVISGGSNGRELRPNVICQAMSHEVCFSLLNKGVDSVISNNNIKYSMLAYGSMFPGFLSVIYTLTMPSNVYNKKKHVRENKYWTDGANFEWGHGFELREVFSQQISDNVKNLTFSQLCKLLYSWSQGSAVCVGVYNYIDGTEGGVLINPERRVRIGDCSSIFVICNDFPVVLAMLKTKHLVAILRRLNEERPKASSSDAEIRARRYTKPPEIDIAGECSLPEPPPGSPVLKSGRTRGRADSRWLVSWMNATPAPEPEESEGAKADSPVGSALEFKRGPNCYRVEIGKGRSLSDGTNNQSPATAPPGGDGESPLLLDNPVSLSLSKRDSTESLFSVATGPAPPMHYMGRGLTFLPEASVVFGEDDGEDVDTSRYLVPKRFSDHVVLVCAFQPTYALIRIVAAVETFVSSTRSRSDEIIVVLSNRADEIEARMRKKARNQSEYFDNKLCFVNGIPNSVRHLRAVDVCFARCVVIVGNEFLDEQDDKNLDQPGGIESSSVSINSDLYILLAALEIDTLLNLHIRHLIENYRTARLPIVIQEIYNDSNNVLLADTCTYVKCDDGMNRASDGEASEEATSSSFVRSGSSKDSQLNAYFSPALLQGRVFSAKMFDALTVQMLYNPNILEFWQVLMGKRRLSNLRKERRDKNSNDSKPGRVLEQGMFDELLVPHGFKGDFRALFELLLSSYGAIAIGLFRHGRNVTTQHVAVMPRAESAVSPKDTVFVLLKGSDS